MGTMIVPNFVQLHLVDVDIVFHRVNENLTRGQNLTISYSISSLLAGDWCRFMLQYNSINQ